MNRVAQVIWTELMPYTGVFTTADVAQAAGVALPNASGSLADLESEGMVVRLTRGLWAIPGHADLSPYAVVPHLFKGEKHGYVSALSALNLHGMIEQIPRVVHVVTTSQRSRLSTPVGTYEFHQVSPVLFDGFVPYRSSGAFDIATPEKALFDAIYLAARKGRRYAHLPELRLGPSFSSSAMEGWISRIRHEPIRVAVAQRWGSMQERRAGRST